jgi:LysM repeat protein
MQPDGALSWWKQSPDHNPTLIASTYIETGCGVATDGNGRYYYICDMGYVTGGTYTPSGGSTTAQQPAAPVMIPVVKADPRPDGSIVHIIRTGQTLWTLAAVYEVPLQQILDLNHYSESQIIHPGDEVIVAGPGSAVPPTPTPTEGKPSPTTTSTQEAEPTHTPRPTNEAGGDLVATQRPTEEQQLVQSDPAALEKAANQNSTVKLVVGISLAGILGVIAASFLIQKPRPPEPPEDDPFAPIQ